MPDIGLGEIIVIVVIALLVFGPDRLPKMAADSARTLRQVRQLAASARKDLVDAAGLENDPEMTQTLNDLRDLDPRQAMNGALTDDPAAGGAASAARAVKKPGAAAGPPSSPAGGTTASQASRAAPDAGANTSTGSSAAARAGTAPGAGASSASGAGDAAAPVAPPVIAPAEVDPDWT